MAYFSLNEDFQGLGSFGCGGTCRCGPCAQRNSARASLAEWYKRDEDGSRPPASPPPPRSNNRPAIGEPPTLHPPFQPTPPPKPPDLFRLSPEFQRHLIEKWERERRNRELTGSGPPPVQRLSLGDAIRRYLDNNLERLMSDLRVPRSLRGHIRNATRDAVGRGATEALDRALTQMGVGGGAREAIISSVRAAMEQIRVR